MRAGTRLNSWMAAMRDASRVLRAGVFSAAEYRRANPDIGRYPALLHYARHGKEFGRRHGQAWLADAVLPHLLSGSIAPGRLRAAVRELEKLETAPDVTHDASARIGNATARTLKDAGVEMADLAFLRAWHDMDFDLARECMPATGPNMKIRGAHMFADTFNDMSFARTALDALGDPRTRRDAETLRLALDLAQATGRSLRPIGRELLARLKRIGARNGSDARLQAQVLGAGLLVFADSPVVELAPPELVGLGGENCPRQDWAEGLLALPRLMRDLLGLATVNSLSDSAFALVPDGSGGWRIGEPNMRGVCLRLLRPNYWTVPQVHNAVTRQALWAQTAFAQACFRDGISILPVAATQLFDITSEAHGGLPVFSYHTLDSKARSLGGDHPPACHYKEGHVPGLVAHDTAGYSGWSHLARLAAPSKGEGEDADINDTLSERIVSSGASKYVQPERIVAMTDEALDTGYVFAALQMPDDTVSALAWVGVDDWLAAAHEAAEASGIPMVVKAHPFDRSSLTSSRLAALRARGGYVVNGPIHELIAGSRCVVTTNSGVGFEALLHPRPVVTCGASDYAAATLQARSREDVVRHVLAALKGEGVSEPEIRAVVARYVRRFCWRSEDLRVLASKAAPGWTGASEAAFQS